MEKDQTDIQRPADCGRRTMRQNRKYGKPAYGETFKAVRNQREHTRPHDRTGGLQLS